MVLIMRKQVGRTQAGKITMRRAKLGEHDRGGDRVAVVEGDGVGWGVAHGNPSTNSDERGSVAWRASRLRTVAPYQAPPRAVAMPRSFNAAAIARVVATPAACRSRTMGRTLAAKA